MRDSNGKSRAKLTLRSNDPLAPLELADSTGTLIKVGQGTLSDEQLLPGFYRVRFRSPEGQAVERLLSLDAGDDEDVLIDPPPFPDTLLTQTMVRDAGAWELPKQSPGIKDLSLMRPSTLLALAGSAANRVPTMVDFKLDPFSVSPFQTQISANSVSGVQLLFAVDSVSPQEADAYLSQVQIRLWPFFDPIAQNYYRPGKNWLFPELFPEFGETVIDVATSGTYWLLLALPGKQPVVFPLALLPERVTMLVVYRDPLDYIHIFQYMPSLTAATLVEFDHVRQLELFQRLYSHGYLEHAFQYLNPALGGHWNDPITGCLAGYLFLQQEDLGQGERQYVDFFFQNVVYRYSNEMSDVHVLMAEYATRQGNHEVARIALARALDVGLPIFADGMTRLLAGLSRYTINHPLAASVAAISPTS